MKRFVLFFVLLIVLSTSHSLILIKAENIAAHLAATKYQELSDDEVGRKVLDEKFADYLDGYRPKETLIELYKHNHYNKYVLEHIKPNRGRIELAANVIFFLHI